MSDTTRLAAGAVRRDRLLATAARLIDAPSPTGRAGPAADALAALLREAGFVVDRPEAGHPDCPAVVARLDSGRPGPTLQFDGHLDVVHLPFAPSRVEGGLLRGSGSADMKGGLAAAVEALFALRDSGALAAGSVLLTAHDLHEAPWGLGQQFDRMLADGIVGDAVLIPEPLHECLPVAGRGAATWQLTLSRDGDDVHEVRRPPGLVDLPSELARTVLDLAATDARLAGRSDPVAGPESLFVGQVHSGAIYNVAPASCWLEGTRRWVVGTSRDEARATLEDYVRERFGDGPVRATLEYRHIRDAFRLDTDHPAVAAFRASYRDESGRDIPAGPKPFVDDGNSVHGLAGRPAITHGPEAGGQHTEAEWASVDDLVRVARVYVATAARFCTGDAPR